MNLIDQMKLTKEAGCSLTLLDNDKRNAVLSSIVTALCCSCSEILTANAQDLAKMPQEDPRYDRLLLTEARIKAMADDIERIISLPAPIGKKLDYRIMENGLLIEKSAVPLGVVAVIYESRPNVTIDVFTLCFKTCNACILKGGKEAYYSNTILVQIIQKVLAAYNIDTNVIYLFPPNRDDTNVLLEATGIVDVCIPRGGKALINFVRNNAKIPVIETGAGVVHAYFDLSGDIIKGREIINNAKTRRVSVCNALDCLLIHTLRLDDLYMLVEPLKQYKVDIFADQDAYTSLTTLYPNELLHLASPDDFGREFLSYKLAIKTVNTVKEAVKYIMSHTSGHSEAIIAEDHDAAKYFVERVDAAVVYVNASTAFTDGGSLGWERK